MTDLTLIPITETPPAPVVQTRTWPVDPVFVIPRTPLPEVYDATWDDWDSAQRWHDSKHSTL